VKFLVKDDPFRDLFPFNRAQSEAALIRSLLVINTIGEIADGAGHGLT